MSRTFTIGYEGTDIDRFLSTLRSAGVELVVDVRAVPLSRKRGFSKKALSAHLEQEGIDYLHIAALGDPKAGREAARAGHYEVFERIYRSHLTTESSQTALRSLSEVVRSRTCCLMCFERDPAVCHRSIVVSALELPAGKVFNLYADLPRRYDHFPESGRHFSESAAAAE